MLYYKLVKCGSKPKLYTPLTYFSTCPFGQLTKKSICPTQSFRKN